MYVHLFYRAVSNGNYSNIGYCKLIGPLTVESRSLTPIIVVQLEIAFNWFLGNNHLHQIVYNPCTGGCYDGLEDTYINLNQGAESTVSYLMARLSIEKMNRRHFKLYTSSQVNKEIYLKLSHPKIGA